MTTDITEREEKIEKLLREQQVKDLVRAQQYLPTTLNFTAKFKKFTSDGNAVQLIFILEPDFIDCVPALVNLASETVEIGIQSIQMSIEDVMD